MLDKKRLECQLRELWEAADGRLHEVKAELAKNISVVYQLRVNKKNLRHCHMGFDDAEKAAKPRYSMP